MFRTPATRGKTEQCTRDNAWLSCVRHTKLDEVWRSLTSVTVEGFTEANPNMGWARSRDSPQKGSSFVASYWGGALKLSESESG